MPSDASNTPKIRRDEMLLRISRDLMRAADEESGSEHSTRVALGRVEQAQRDLQLVKHSLLYRLAVIQRAV